MRNKELKNDIIEYFVTEYYSKFKELTNVYSEEVIKQRLNKNIKKLITNKKSVVYLGRYYIINKKIRIYNKTKNIKNKNLEIDDIKKNLKLKSTILHEFTHALLRRNIVTTGCFTINFSISMFKNYPKNVMKNRGLNEGITNWIVEKSGVRINSYRLETNIIKQLEVCIGSENILKLVTQKSRNVKDILKLNKKDYRKFTESIDKINNFDIKLIKKINKNKNNSKSKSILKYKQKREKNALFLQEFVYDHFIKSILNEEKILKIYTLMLNYQNCIGNVKIKEVLILEDKLKSRGLL